MIGTGKGSDDGPDLFLGQDGGQPFGLLGDETPDPGDAGFFGADGIVFDLQQIAHLVEQFL